MRDKYFFIGHSWKLCGLYYLYNQHPKHVVLCKQPLPSTAPDLAIEKRIYSRQNKLSGFLNVSIPACQTKQSWTPAVLRMPSQYSQVHRMDILSAAPALWEPNLIYQCKAKKTITTKRKHLLHLKQNIMPSDDSSKAIHDFTLIINQYCLIKSEISHT